MSFYKTNLLQIDSTKGYIENGVDNLGGDFTAGYFLFGESEKPLIENWALDEIIVKPTLNKFFVREIRTGMLIPLVHCSRKEFYGEKGVDPELHVQKSVSHPYGRFHTFVRRLTSSTETKKPGILFEHIYETFSFTEIGPEPTEKEMLDYLEKHRNKEAFEKQLQDYFLQGEQNMKNIVDTTKKIKRRIALAK